MRGSLDTLQLDSQANHQSLQLHWTEWTQWSTCVSLLSLNPPESDYIDGDDDSLGDCFSDLDSRPLIIAYLFTLQTFLPTVTVGQKSLNLKDIRGAKLFGTVVKNVNEKIGLNINLLVQFG